MRRNRSKKRLALCLLLALALMLAPAAWAEENYDTLADWDIRVKVPDGKTAVLQGGEYYIYAGAEGYIPYVMLRAYRYDSAEGFLADFTDYMRGEYDDLTVTQEATPVTIGDKSGFEIIYFYRLSGYEVKDRRVAVKHGERVYMFASKEIEALGQTVDGMLDEVVADCTFLAEPAVTPDAPEETVYSPGYLYTLPNGMPKYFVDFSGEEADDVVLHCWFRSGDPSFYSSAFVLHLDAAQQTAPDGALFPKITGAYDFDCSAWFKELRLAFDGDELVMTVERDESTLAGGAGDNILTGRYLFKPKTFFRPLSGGPFTGEELARLAQIHYFITTGFYPPEADAEKNPNGSFTIHLYENVKLDGGAHTATSAWYTVGVNGVGVDLLTGESVNLIPSGADRMI